MLSLGKLASGQQEYYLQTVARGAEEYYVGAKEAPGQWLGVSARRLGLDGEVDAEQLHRVLSHEHPCHGSRLTASRSVPEVIGFDATFCAPKSVSLLFALGDRETSNEVRNAHDVAVSEAFAVFERLARGRRDHGGTRLVDGEGFVAAAFRHRTSRAADPQLHTHVVIANLVHAPEDERWTALDARPLYPWCRPVGHLYEAQLRWELTRRLGVSWSSVRNGIADIAGVPEAAIRAFSTRRAEIEAHLADRAEAGARAAQRAAYATRQPKDTTLDAGALLALWQAKADAAGLDEHTLAGTLAPGRRIDAPRPGSPDAEVLYRRLASPDGLTANRSIFTERHVIEAICDALPNGAPVRDVLALADAFLPSDHVVALTPHAPSLTLRRRDGRLVPSCVVESRFTTPEMLATEQRLLASATARSCEHAGIARHEAVEAGIAARPTCRAPRRCDRMPGRLSLPAR